MKKRMIGIMMIATIATVPLLADMKAGSIKLGLFDDEESAYSLVKIPMEQVLKIALDKTPGQIVSAKLEKDDGYLVYEVKVVDKSNEEVEFDIDPVTGEILDVDKE